MMRVEIGVKMERLAEVLLKTPNRLEDIRDICLELATDIDQYLQEVEEGSYDTYDEDEDDDDDEEEEVYEPEEDERYQEYKYRFGGDDDDE